MHKLTNKQVARIKHLRLTNSAEQVAQLTGLAKSTVFRYCANGTARRPVADQMAEKLRRDLSKLTGREFTHEELVAAALPLLAEALSRRVTDAVCSLFPPEVFSNE